jgi:PAS domain S-box-containing protein
VRESCLPDFVSIYIFACDVDWVVVKTTSESQAIIDTLREPFLVLDNELTVKAANLSFYNDFGVTPEQTLDRTIGELGNGQYGGLELRTLLDGITGGVGDAGTFSEFSLNHDFPGIGQRSMLLNGRALAGGSKERSILLGIEDVTRRRTLEAKLFGDQEWFRVTLASIADAVIATDGNAIVIYLNPTAESLTGWKSEEAVGRALVEVFNIVNESTRAPAESPVSKAIRLGAKVGPANHTVLIARDGRERAIDDSAAPIRDATGTVTGVVMVFHDIAERREAEARIAFSEVRYRRLFEAADDGILILDSAVSTITDVNPFMLKLLHFSRAHFIGRELWEIGVFVDKQQNQDAMKELREKGSIRIENMSLLDRNGHHHSVEIVANLYQEGDHTVIQLNVRDISVRKQFEREREVLLANERLARMEAEAANRSKDLFLAMLSHEVRTPLNAILGWATVLRDPKRSEADLDEGLEVIERNCKLQAQLIEDVLDVARINSGKLELKIGPCQLTEVITHAMAVVGPAAAAKGVRLECTMDPAAGHASCDSARIQQVIWNLLSNAVKFTNKGGTVRIALLRDRSTACITVSDSGLGIAADFLPYVFERFRQADSSTKRRFGGLGLGLSIVKHLVELHGGTVSAHSDGLGTGSTFSVNLPVRAVAAVPETAAPAASTDLPQVRLDGLRVLMVDDEADARRLLGKVLEESGAIVTAVRTVAEAMEAITNGPLPEVLISDIAMPDEDGYDLIRRVRGMGINAKQLPAVALTAFAHKEDRRRVLLSGFQVHVAKPVDPHELSALVASLAGRTGV